MSPKFVAVFVFIFVCGTILGLVMENDTVGAEEQSTLDHLLVWQQITSEEDWGPMDVIGFIPDFFSSLFKALLWDFSFIDGDLVYIKWIVWAPMMAMAIWGFVLTFLSIFTRAL